MLIAALLLTTFGFEALAPAVVPAPAPAPTATEALGPTSPNVLLLLLDDVGVDNVGLYAAHPNPANTPVMDSLAAGGMLFTNAYSNPVCSPTRATILTGRYAHRTGIGAPILFLSTGDELSTDEVALPEVLPPSYGTAVVGKWHLGNDLDHPLDSGFDHHYGSINSIPASGGLGNGYFDYDKNEDGTEIASTTYATTETVDDALSLMGTLGEPWLLWVAFNSAHTPFHAPPSGLHTYTLPPMVGGNEPLHSQAMIEALDAEIGRLLASMDPGELANTVVILLGDNGPDFRAVTPPWDSTKVKGTVFEGGIHVPMIVSGPGVSSNTVCDGLVNTTDLFATITELTGGTQTTGEDSVSLVPYFSNPTQSSLREFAYAEFFTPLGVAATYQKRHRALRGERYKLIYEYVPFSLSVDTKRLYDLQTDPTELTNLLDNLPLSPEALVAMTILETKMNEQGPSPWVDVSLPLAGTHGDPHLDMAGTMVAFSPVTVDITNALESALFGLVVGASTINAPFNGGTFVPAPDVIEFFGTDVSGEFSLLTNWPPALLPFTPVTFQAWIFDPAGPFGFASTNAVTGTTPP